MLTPHTCHSSAVLHLNVIFDEQWASFFSLNAWGTAEEGVPNTLLREHEALSG